MFGQTQSPVGEGVKGVSVATTGPGMGVRGETNSPSGFGVAGLATGASGGAGVLGEALRAGAVGGVFAGSGGAVALEVDGPVEFLTSSGIATIPAGDSSVVVSPGFDITPSAVILCTLMTDPGGTTTVAHVIKDAAADSFEVNLTADATRNVKVGWFVIS